MKKNNNLPLIITAAAIGVVLIVALILIFGRGKDGETETAGSTDTSENQNDQQVGSSRAVLPDNWHDLSVLEQTELDPYGCKKSHGDDLMAIDYDGRCVIGATVELPDGQTLRFCYHTEEGETPRGCENIELAIYQDSAGSDADANVKYKFDEDGLSLSLISNEVLTNFVDPSGVWAIRDDSWQGNNCGAEAFANESGALKYYTVDHITDSPYGFTFDVSEKDDGRRYCFRILVNKQGGSAISDTPVYLVSDPVDLSQD